jgi:hypothetical protein
MLEHLVPTQQRTNTVSFTNATPLKLYKMQSFFFLKSYKTGNVSINVTLRCVHVSNVAVEKQYYIFWVCVSVAFVIQHAKRMHRIILVLLSVACMVLPYFSTLSHKQHDFRRKVLNIKCVFWFFLQILSEKFLFLKIIQRDIFIYIYIYICTGIHVKYPLFLSDFNKRWIFSTDFRKVFKYKILWKSLQWQPSCSMRTDGQTDRHDERNSRF